MDEAQPLAPAAKRRQDGRLGRIVGPRVMATQIKEVSSRRNLSNNQEARGTPSGSCYRAFP